MRATPISWRREKTALQLPVCPRPAVRPHPRARRHPTEASRTTSPPRSDVCAKPWMLYARTSMPCGATSASRRPSRTGLEVRPLHLARRLDLPDATVGGNERADLSRSCPDHLARDRQYGAWHRFVPALKCQGDALL